MSNIHMIINPCQCRNIDYWHGHDIIAMDKTDRYYVSVIVLLNIYIIMILLFVGVDDVLLMICRSTGGLLLHMSVLQHPASTLTRLWCEIDEYCKHVWNI